MNKLVILGLDGFDIGLLKKFMNEGIELPNFKYIMENGFYGKMRSIIPPVTRPAWTALFTGRKLGNIGVYDFFVINSKYERKMLDIVDIYEGNFLWDILNKNKKSCGIVYVPMIEIKKDVDKFFFNSWDEFAAKYGKKLPRDKSLTPFGKMKNRMKRFVKKIDVFTQGIDEDIDVYFGHFFVTDAPIHTIQNFREVYKLVDEKLGDVIRKCEEKNYNLLIVSDHGGKQAKTRFNLNVWLRKNGYLKLRSPPGIKMKLLDYMLSFNPILVRTLLQIIKETKNLHGSEKSPTEMRLEEIDWKETKAFAMSSLVLELVGIWINKKSYFENGTVVENDVEKMKEEIKKRLEKEKAVKKVWKKEDIFSSNSNNLPDLLVEAKEGYLISRRHYNRIYSKCSRFFHNYHGTVMGIGPDLRSGGIEIEEIEIEDITPTILHMNKLPVIDNIDGKVRLPLLSDDYKNTKVKYTKGKELKIPSVLNEEKEKEILERLTKLGYNIR